MLVWTLESEKHLFVSIGTVVCAVATSRTVDCHAWRERLVHLREKEPECPNPCALVPISTRGGSLSRMSSQTSYLRREEMPYSAVAYTESSSSSSDSSPNSSGDHPSSSEGTSSSGSSSNREPTGDFRVLTGEFKKAAPAAVVAGLGRPRPPTPVRERQNVSQTTFWGGMTSVSLHPTPPLSHLLIWDLLKNHTRKLLLLPTTSSLSSLALPPAPLRFVWTGTGPHHNGRRVNVTMNRCLLLCLTWSVRVMCVACVLCM